MRHTPAAGGSALLVVLWVIALLSLLIITSMMVAMQDVETVASRRQVFRARMLAETGVSIGASSMVKPGDPVLRKQLSPLESYDVNITTAESQLNINALLTEERRVVLERLFGSWGLQTEETQSVVDALMDWVAAEDFRRLKGAEKSDYKKEGMDDHPYNHPFQSLDEMGMVRGMDLVANVNPQWREAFTLWGSGALDINEAPAELIAVVADIPLNSARALVATRNGPDGVPHTADDTPLKSLDEANAYLGGKVPSAAALFTLKGAMTRVDSTGRAGDYTRHLSVMLRDNTGGQSPIVEWSESGGE